MEFLSALWLPIVLSSIVLFILSAMAWMVMPHHRSDFRQLENENEFMQQLRSSGVPAGRYMFPNGNSAEARKDPEFQQRMKDGPMGTLTLFDGMNMGKNMLWTYVFFLVSSMLLAYLGWLALSGRTDLTFMFVFRVLSTAGVLTYSCASIPNSIWFKHAIWTNLLDGIVFGLATGLIFASLWPR